MYNNILIPVVFDEGQDTQASYLAAKPLANDNANFTVIHVRDNIPSFVAAEIPNEVLEASRREVAGRLCQSLTRRNSQADLWLCREDYPGLRGCSQY